MMKVRIGIADTDKVVEVEADDEKSFKKELEKAIADGGLAWFKDIKGRSIGIAAGSIAFVEVESSDGEHTVGFAPAV